jgi:hypothetical protein
MLRAYFSNSIEYFLGSKDEEIIGTIANNNDFP